MLYKCVCYSDSNCVCDTDCDCDLVIRFNSELNFPYGSHHIGKFGGKEDGMFDLSTITWTAADRVRLAPKFHELTEKYSADIHGSIQLLADLMSKHGANHETTVGSLIYHQLSYCDPLTATFQTGCCISAACVYRPNSS
jgi:hypothetical protein